MSVGLLFPETALVFQAHPQISMTPPKGLGHSCWHPHQSSSTVRKRSQWVSGDTVPLGMKVLHREDGHMDTKLSAFRHLFSIAQEISSAKAIQVTYCM